MATSRKQQTKKSNSNKRNVMENTLENKEKFFSQYWGQKVAYHDKMNNWYVGKGVLNLDMIEYLELTPLSKVTDEDAIKVASIVLGKEIKPIELINWDWRYNIIVNREKSIQEENVEIEMYVAITYDTGEIRFIWDYKHKNGVGQQDRHCPNSVSAYDYLRSKGYAVPYNGVSVEKQIEYGWINLKTN